MPLNLPDGTNCFVDSNILYYALVPTEPVSEHCLKLIERAVAGRVALFVSDQVLSDTIHKVMISEVAQLTGRDRAGMVGYLGKHPEVIARLTAVRHRLLTNDATIIALMARHALTHLVTNDDDFDRVPDSIVWKPR
jgi:predicted nucleic acid-binding protein